MQSHAETATAGLWIFRLGIVLFIAFVPFTLLMTLTSGASDIQAGWLAMLVVSLVGTLKLMSFGLAMHRSQQQAEHLDAIAVEDGKSRYPGELGNLALLAYGMVMIFGAYYLSKYLYS